MYTFFLDITRQIIPENLSEEKKCVMAFELDLLYNHYAQQESLKWNCSIQPENILKN